eukprot:COSAG06_NODE_1952_length_7992_cov_4.274294_7_plen_71_part_00
MEHAKRPEAAACAGLGFKISGRGTPQFLNKRARSFSTREATIQERSFASRNTRASTPASKPDDLSALSVI